MTFYDSDTRLRDRAIAKTLPIMPRGLVQRLSAPYIAGERLDQATAEVKALFGQGMSATVDVLGEAIRNADEARATHAEYMRALDSLAELGESKLINVSLKLTALGLDIDESLTNDLVIQIVDRAKVLGGFVRIDMEDSPYTDQTLKLYDDLRKGGYENVGVVIQAYLKRSADDVKALGEVRARVRIVKGIYIEPHAIAYKDMRVINRNYVALCRSLFESGCHVAMATHDEMLVYDTQKLINDLSVPKSQYEYQMLLGVQEALRDDLVERGQPMRVYVPYGARWYEYSLRRLRENPRVAGYVAADIARGLTSKLIGKGRKRRGGKR